MIAWRLALALLPDLAQLARGILGLVFGILILTAPIVGLLAQPWAPWWFADRTTALLAPLPTAAGASPDLGDIAGRVSDAQRYQLARAAGFSQDLAILATAISIAENGSGNPAALSGRNFNGTYDLGLWQINTIWWAGFGGRDALTDPWRNAQAAFAIYGRQGWCAWSTYEVSCGPGHTGSYRSFLERARQASLVQVPANQA